MKKYEFLLSLEKKLHGLPIEEIGDRLDFYNEMIDDRIEEGVSEEEAVANIGNIDDIVKEIISETSLGAIVKERIKPKRRLKTWDIVLLAIGSPIWLSLIIAAFAVILSLYASIWAAVISLWSVFVSFIGCSIGGVFAVVIAAAQGNPFAAVAMLGASLVCAGLSIFSFHGCLIFTKAIVLLTKKIVLSIKKCFIKKEVA